jgi:hypothetical protein
VRSRRAKLSAKNLKTNSAGQRIAAAPALADPLEGRLVVRLNEAWDILQVSPSKGFQLIKDGRLKVTRLDRVTLAHVASIRELLK